MLVFAKSVGLRRHLVVVWVAAVSLVAVVSSARGQTFSEEEALAQMQASYPEFRALALGVREVEAESETRGLLANPNVSFTREDTRFGRDDFFLVSQELPFRGHLRLLREAGRQAVGVAEARADIERLALVRRLRAAFVDLLYAQARQDVLAAGVIQLTRLVDTLRLREQAGEGSRFDRLRAEREVTDVEIDRETGLIETFRRQAQLASFLGIATDPTDVRAAGGLSRQEPVPPFDLLLARARENRPDYRALTQQAARWEAERRAARRLRFPAAAVTAGVKRSLASRVSDTGYAVTATIGVPVFDRGQAQVGRAEAARARAETRRLTLEIHLVNDVRATHTAASRYRALVERYQTESVEPAAELASIATAAYEEGVYGILELLDAHRVKLRTELRLLELSVTARHARIDLDHAVGTLR